MNNQDIGKLGEDTACDFLIKNGYKILDRNWRCHPKEIDIIAQKSTDDLRIVEVKTRSTDYFQQPSDLITPAKQKFLEEAANQYIEAKNIQCDVYYDLITIYTNYTPMKIIHVEECFTP